MSALHTARLREWLTATRDERGQTLVLVVICLLVFIGLIGLVVDVGQLHVVQRRLQSAADASALAAASNLATSTTAATTYADDYDATTGYNQIGGSTVLTTIAYGCLSSSSAGGSQLCTPNANQNGTTITPFSPQCLPTNTPSCTPNAVRVTESTSVYPSFMSALHVGAQGVSVSATASVAGGLPQPLNAEVIVDTTASMADPDTSCTGTGLPSNPTSEDCAKGGVRAFLAGLTPCSGTLGCGTDTADVYANTVDRVGLMVFPALSTAISPGTRAPFTGVPDEQLCNNDSIRGNTTYNPDATYYANGSGSTAVAYSNYQAIPFESDFLNQNGGTLKSTSPLVLAVSDDSCNPVAYPASDEYGLEDPGGEQTYYGDMFTYAYDSLKAETTNVDPGAANAIVFVSDGNANSDKSNLANTNDPTGVDECQAAIADAESVEYSDPNLIVIAIAYNSEAPGPQTSNTEPSICPTDYTETTSHSGNTWTLNTPNSPGEADYSDGSPECTMIMMVDNSITNPAFTNDQEALANAEAPVSQGGEDCADPTPSKAQSTSGARYYFYNSPNGNSLPELFGAAAADLTSSRLVSNNAT